MTPEDFSFLANLLKERSGLLLSEERAYMLETRLMPVVRAFNMADLGDLTTSLRQRDVALTEAFAEAMTTNETLFFRDQKPFKQLKDMALTYFFKTREQEKTIRILSAGCSAGQEAYSIAMIAKEALEARPDWKIEIVAVDISSKMIRKAIEGKYSQFEVQRGLPIKLLLKYFTNEGETWQIDDSLRSMVKFERWNLLDDITSLGSFDIIFCRNVLQHFDPMLKPNLLAKLANQMPKDGCLFLGKTESILGISDRFKMIKDVKGIYAVA